MAVTGTHHDVCDQPGSAAEARAQAVTSLVDQLGSTQHLDRERARLRLRASLKDAGTTETTLNELRKRVSEQPTSEDWHGRLAWLNTAEILLESQRDFTDWQHIVTSCVNLLEDDEVRVREAISSCVRLLAAQHGAQVVQSMQPAICQSIENNWERTIHPALVSTEESTPAELVSEVLNGSYRRRIPGTGDMRHGSEGWHALETSCKVLQGLIQGSGPAYKPFLDDAMQQRLWLCLYHPNRFIRETGYETCGDLCNIFAGPALQTWGKDLAVKLQDGLSENWSQVRLAACHAVRALLLNCDDRFREELLPLLMPQLCFNRWHESDGVKLYSQGTWQQALKQQGPAWLARCLPQVLQYYESQARSNNNRGREAACHCMAELVRKLESPAILPYLSRIMKALLSAFRDDSWPVRDGACLAAASCALAYPEECKPWLEVLFPLWKRQLDDNVWSVRAHAAVALADLVRAYQQPALDIVLPCLREMLPKAQEQPETTNIQDPDRPAPPGVVVVPIIPQQPHTDTTALFQSSGLIRNKAALTAIGDSCGCMEYGYTRPRQPWEASDGAVYLLRQLAEVEPQQVVPFLSTLAHIARLNHFPHARNLQETIWKQLGAIMSALGKRAFKPYLEPFIEPLFDSLTCGQQTTAAAAGEFIGQVRDLLGPNIWAGRLSSEQQAAQTQSPHVPPPAGQYAGIAVRPTTYRSSSSSALAAVQNVAI
ncbi:hypothetical protein WJX77_006689 [Trebouxia sp. C0004]